MMASLMRHPLKAVFRCVCSTSPAAAITITTTTPRRYHSGASSTYQIIEERSTVLAANATLSEGSSPPLIYPASNDVSWTEFLFQNTAKHGEKLAFACEGKEISHATLLQQVLNLSAALQDAGMKQGDIVLLNAFNCNEYPLCIHATLLAGGILSPSSPLSVKDDLVRQMKMSKARWIMTTTSLANVTAEAATEAGVSKHNIIIFGDEGQKGSHNFVSGTDLLSSSTVDVGAYRFPKVDAENSIALLPFSSGTTGLPKGVMISHTNLIANLLQVSAIEPYRNDCLIGILPMYHIYGMFVLNSFSIYHGATSVLLPKFDLEKFCQIVEDYQITRAHVAPPVAVLLAKDPVVSNYDFSSLKVILSGAAPLSKEIEEEVCARLDCKVKQTYGLTEMSPVTHITRDDSIRQGSIGDIVPGSDFKIVPSDGSSTKPIPIGETGELLLRGPHVMMGYLNNFEATRAVIDKDGFFHTGDIAKCDSDGYFYIVDRLKELIKYKGRQVAPAELEALLLTNDAVRDVCVIPSVQGEEEIPKAYIVLHEGITKTEDEIMTWVAGKVAPYKKVREVEFVESVPKTASGKLLRRQLVLLDRATKGQS